MKDILSNINTLDGFMTTREVIQSLDSADEIGRHPGQMAPYNGPEVDENRHY